MTGADRKVRESEGHVVQIVTVHGTGDTAASVEGDKWFQRGSRFVDNLKDHLAAAGLDCVVTPHLWSGANSAMAREAAALSLKRKIEGISGRGGPVHVIGHSHGGNVANDAAHWLDWRRAKGPRRIASLTTVGTPFLSSRVGRLESVLTWAFAILTVLGIASTAYIIAVLEYYSYWWVLALDLFVARFAVRALGRVMRARRGKRPDPQIHAIRHPNDEAIAFLQHAERLKLDPFPRWSLARRAGPGAVMFSTPVMIAAFFYSLPQAARLAEATHAGHVDASAFHNVLTVVVSSVMLASAMAGVVFVAFYLAIRLLALIMFEFALRGILNKSIGDALTGIALGRDGDLRIGHVSVQSHAFGTREAILDGEVAERMRAAANEATRRLFDKYRGSLFSVGADASNAVIEMAQDAMTWDSLIHTTYFDQPEVAGLIADHILSTECAPDQALRRAV